MIAAPVQLRCHRCLTSLLVYQCCLRSTAAARSSPPAVSFSRKDLALMSLHDRHHFVLFVVALLRASSVVRFVHCRSMLVTIIRSLVCVASQLWLASVRATISPFANRST
uniref:Putative secreted protein n=1 Tax=Anopheles darlingi TaxID=43151 RepID=A0A2M4D1N4_ANODA